MENWESLTFSALRKANKTRSKKSFGKNIFKEWSEADWAVAAAGEMGEVCDAIKKRKRGWDKPGKDAPSKKDVADEIADVICYLDLLAHKMDIDLSEAIRRKFNEVSDRLGSDIKL